ncbi:hypothetical protein O3G_MSEX010557 [Manduca sexta]|nr:hypothetical protein O3G_MSEX010557 [Manduca sexta]
MGAAAAPVRVRTYVRWSAQARLLPECQHATSGIFYSNITVLNLCSFLSGNQHSGNVTMYTIATEKGALEECISFATDLKRVNLKNRTTLKKLVNDAPGSFLFHDWDMWQHVPGVEALSDWCASRRLSPDRDSEPVGVRAIHESLFKYAPPLLRFTQHFVPEPNDLREVLELEASRNDDKIEEAACDWANNNPKRLQQWLKRTKRFDHSMLAIVCKEDPLQGLDVYRNITIFMGKELWKVSKLSEFGVNVYLEAVNCSQPEEAGMKFKHFMDSTESYRAIGVVAARESALILAKEADMAHMPLVVYDVNTEGAHASVGHLGDLAAAFIKFFQENNWNRVAVLSESTSIAEELVRHLEDRLCIYNIEMSSNKTELALRKLEARRARVILLNMEIGAAEAVLNEASRLGMTPANKYAWVAREWKSAPLPAGMSVFTVSFSCNRGGQAVENTSLRLYFETLWQDAWPARAVSYVDALLTIVHGFVTLVRDYPQYRNDHNGQKALECFWKGLEKINASGVCQQLRYKGTALAEPLVFIDEWVESKPMLLAEWRIRHGKIVNITTYRQAYPHGRPVHDGSSRCIVQSGNCFTPDCHDVNIALGSIALVATLLFVPFVVQLARRAYRQRLDKIKSELGRSWLSHREQKSQALASYLVPREHLELREELGAGRSGRVHLALLRSPGRTLRAVAAKSLRNDAAPSEEGEFLREACTLVSLDHEHVVRLVGVCIGDPLLVLMEHAFFGDLLRYLRARRHLAEGADIEASSEGGDIGSEEAAHVSAEALTRLVREAAAALAYLAHRGLVHRDVRAANCLVDSRRSIKLGDFGMARETSEAGADGAAEYACRRRGMFPVLWMAPESLERGAFSAASDVWGLGVLAFEVVTLGARPYGACPPLRVLQLVTAGGRPRLPLDATAQTRGVTNACWRRVARERPTASELVAYLAEHPRALQPALALDYDEPDVDSGYGEPDVADSPDIFDGPSPDSATAFFPA